MEQSNRNHNLQTPKKIVVLKNDLQAINGNESDENIMMSDCVIMDSSDTQPGYCRLRIPSKSSIDEKEVFQHGSNIYLKPFKIPRVLYSKLRGWVFDKIRCIGVFCPSFPFSRRWPGSRRHTFPSRVTIDSIIRTGCTLIPKSHRNSAYPDIEWQFNFSVAEFSIFKSLTIAQKHGYYVLKALLDQMIHHITFKQKYLKNVYLMSCEKISSSAWETNFSGCVLYVLDALLSCLKSRFLPNYFILESNLIEGLQEDEINALITVVEYIRLFPACTIQIVADRYGFTSAPNLIERVLVSVEEFSVTENCEMAFHGLFLPLTMAMAKRMAKIGFYQASYDMLEEAFEQSLLIPREGLKQMSVSFHHLFEKTVKEMKQRSSRILLSEIFDLRTGSNISTVFKKPLLPLQSCLEWTIDSRLNWMGVPSDNIGDLIAISKLLYVCSRREYFRQNKLLAELTITTAIRCIHETLRKKPSEITATNGSHTNDEMGAETRKIKKMLIQYYIQSYFVSKLDWTLTPFINYLDDIENLCNEFPEMARIVSEMFGYADQPEKCQQYARLFHSHLHGSGKNILISYNHIARNDLY